MSKTVAVIGAGISGTTVALELEKYGMKVHLIEKGNEVVNGPPACHLHAGGNLYPEIPVEDAKELLRESIEFARRYPLGINHRPTLLCVPKDIPFELEELIDKAQELKKYYFELISQDLRNEVLGLPDNYYTLYYEDDVAKLLDKPYVEEPITHSDWLGNVVEKLVLDTLKFPIMMINEPGIALFRIAALIEEELKNSSVKVHLNSQVLGICMKEETLELLLKCEECEHFIQVDFVVNAAGYQSGAVDKLLGIYEEEMVEFKAAYLVNCTQLKTIPEIIFHGIRGTTKGMGQLTPQCGNYFQLHSMTHESTLFENGISHSCSDEKLSLNSVVENILIQGFSKEELERRTYSAVSKIGKYIKIFDIGNVVYKPFFGIQKISKGEISKRTGGVDFSENYIRIELVKYSSIINIARKIIEKILGETIEIVPLKTESSKIEEVAEAIAVRRGYPKEIAKYYLKSKI
ncbi:MAG: FAD-dependent oxidoreductase [Fusobacteria bacterium]|nr:FAD-dependent oxidoreductase [Fusobacteriota bacterium]